MRADWILLALPFGGAPAAEVDLPRPSPWGPGISQAPAPFGSTFVSRAETGRSTTATVAMVERMNRPEPIRGGRDRVLVLYDDQPATRWVGELYAQQLANLLGHFPVKVERAPLSAYRTGDLAKFRAGFYLGLVGSIPLPQALQEDILSGSRPFCWIGRNLELLPSDRVSERFGLRYVGLDGQGYPSVRYRGVELRKEPSDPILTRISLEGGVEALATASGSAGMLPYLVRARRNFWFVADNPMATVDAFLSNDRVLAFADALHDILGTNCPELHRAVVRIEDVRSVEDPALLTRLARICQEEGVPFAVCVIPEFEDPMGRWPSLPRRQNMDENPAFLEVLRDMRSRGGALWMHGVTHQYAEEANPTSGVSGEDFEFFRVESSSIGPSWYAPTPESSAEARDRIQRGRDRFRAASLPIAGWVTPHYLAGPIHYAEFVRQFDLSLCRGVSFSVGSDGTLYGLQQLTPYPLIDTFGMRRLPETLGYIEPSGQSALAGNGAAMVRRAEALKAVRCGWASFYFHTFVPEQELRTALRGIHAAGFRFVPPTLTSWRDGIAK